MQWRPAAFYQSRRESAFAFQGDERVKIIVVEPYTKTPGHFEWFAVRTCEAFHHLKNEVTLVTYGGIETSSLKGPCPFAVVDAAPDGRQDLDVRCHHGKMDMASLRAFLKKEMQEFRTFRLAASLSRQSGQRVLHFCAADPVVLEFVLRSTLPGRLQRKDLAILLTVHDATMLNPAKRIKGKAYRWLYRRRLKKLIQRDLDGIVVLDPTLKQELINRLTLDTQASERVYVLTHGAEHPVNSSSKQEARKRLKLHPSETVFLVFGILRKDKKIDLAIEAVKELSKCRLVIAGEAQDYTERDLMTFIRRHGCERWVSTEIGYVSERKMDDYFSACDAVIIPYARSFKGMSGILTHACSHGRAVIASDVGILGETVKKWGIGFAVEPENTMKLREGICRFLDLTPEERVEMEQRASRFARHCSWDVVCQEWVALYHRLLNQQRMSP